MPVAVTGVQWDKGNLVKCRKRGLTVGDIEYVLLRGMKFMSRDLRNSKSEGRYIAIGETKTGRLAFIAFTLRPTGDGVLMRPFSARFMHRKEIDKYE